MKMIQSQSSDHPHRANKLLGQHFLRSQKIIDDIVRASGIGVGDTVLEIGPGKGILTRALAAKAKKVIAIEKDPKLVPILKKLFVGKENIEIVEGDAIKIPRTKLGLREGKYTVVANLPYYLTSRFLRIFLELPPRPRSMTLMTQYEVAHRIVADIPDMNLLALSVQAFGTPRLEKKVSRMLFYPHPKVDSAVISIVNISDAFFKKNNIKQELFFALTKKAFSQKRKTLKNSLGIASRVRPQELGLEEWAKITRQLA